MADVLLINARGNRGGALRALRESAAHDPMGVHRLTDDPAHADVILFVEVSNVGPSLRSVRHHPLYRQHRDRSFAYSEYDFIVPLVPGIYPSASGRWNVGNRARGGPYASWHARTVEVPALRGRPRYLFSFVGAAHHHPVRRAVMRLQHAGALLADTGWWYATADKSADRVATYRAQYEQSLADSLFVLCPRGMGASSVRLFDVMQAGRVPVILSDEWLSPEGPDWSSFSLRVKEGHVEQIPALLEARAPEAVEMGRRARQAWETWFHPDRLFHHFTEACLSIRRARTLPERVARPLAASQFVLHPPTVRTCLWRLRHGRHEQKPLRQPEPAAQTLAR